MKNAITMLLLILFTSVSMAQWSEQSSGVSLSLNSVSAVNDNVAWICGNNGLILKTTNGGNNWTRMAFPDTTLNLNCILGFGANTALVAGTNTIRTNIYRTTDGGTTWNSVFTQDGGFIKAMVRVGQVIGAVGNPVGGRWTLPGSQNLGATWDTAGYTPLFQQNNETGWTNSMFSAGCKTWFGTNNTRLYYDLTCEPPVNTLLTPGLINSMSIWSSDSVLMVGGEGLLVSTNLGNVWNISSAPGAGNIVGITGAGNNWRYIRSASIYFSSNKGASWISEYTAPSGTFTHMQKSLSGNRVWAVRSNGGISMSDGTIGIRQLSEFEPINFNLYQNYPNPFNPVTKIKFQIPSDVKRKTSDVKLTVYNILGKEIATLVNEHLQPGVYEVLFDGSNLPSGIYFYSLKTGNYVEAKRMILVK